MKPVADFKNRDRFVDLGLLIAALRKRQGLSQEQLAEKANISRLFFASTFWRKMQNIFGECCISKLEKVAKPRLAAVLPAA